MKGDVHDHTREHVERVLRGEATERVPFTMYESMIPQCVAERAMRNRGLCIVKRDVPVYKTHRPHVQMTQQVYWDGERRDGAHPL